MMRRRKKTTFQKIWYFIWEDDSVLSWILNVLIAFVLIKFLVYPVIGLTFDTSHPIVAVVSGSMEHKTVHPCILSDAQGCVKYNEDIYWMCSKQYNSKKKVDYDFFWNECGSWYEDKDITKDEFSEFKFKNGFNTGDIIFIRGVESENIEIGDIIVFEAGKAYPIIHRVVEKRLENGQLYFTTKGDHNPTAGKDDMNITGDKIIGKATIKIPYLGWIKIAAFKLLFKLNIIG